MRLAHKFVKSAPEILDEGVLYISMDYGTALHKCCWQLLFDGKTISLYPSIGNWSFKCRSHYWIWNSEVEWAASWGQREIDAAKDRYDCDNKTADRTLDLKARLRDLWK
jgi:hypothetical protein